MVSLRGAHHSFETCGTVSRLKAKLGLRKMNCRNGYESEDDALVYLDAEEKKATKKLEAI
jgi:hypothetical protein